MICDPCRRGGQLNLDASVVTDEATIKWLYARALEEHGKCNDRCECHHVIGITVQSTSNQGSK